ncbi:MAG: hypothetical protein AB8G22_23125 [Saprospiraceae bacterium]
MIRNFLFLLSILLSPFCTIAQTASVDQVEVSDVQVFTLEEDEKTPLVTTQKEIAHYYGQFHKRLPADYNGYIIELLQTERPLARDHIIFQQFGKIFYDKLTDGQYGYCILAQNFTSVESLERYVESMVIHRAPTAAVVEYKNGKRRKKAKDKNKNCCPGLSKL